VSVTLFWPHLPQASFYQVQFLAVRFLPAMEVIHKSENGGILRSFELKKMLRSLGKMRTHPP